MYTLSVEQLVFLVAGAVTLIAALMVVASPRMVHAALWLIVSLAGIAALFIMLNAGFLAVVQVAVYIDAIAILIIIVVMLTRRVMKEGESQITRNGLIAAVVAFLILGGLIALFHLSPALSTGPPPLTADSEAILEDLGQALVDVDRYILPFEVASVLLLAALIGSIMVAWPQQEGKEEEGSA